MRQYKVPMSSPDITPDEVKAVTQVLETLYLSIGPRIDAFEKKTAAFIGVRHAVGVSSGTAGLHLGVIAAGVEEGDLVITTPFSFIASANCILYERAVPLFVDVDPITGNIDPGLVVEAAHDLRRGRDERRWLPRSIRHTLPAVGHRLKAVLPVHAFGQAADMDPIMKVSRQYGLAVIEDACEAIGAEYKGKKVGSFGDVAVFAFYPNKQMTTGEGGILVTNRGEWDALFRSLRNQGRDVFDAWLCHSRLGYNHRLDEMSAALGLAQIGRIDGLLSKREQVAQWYNERLSGVEGVQIPTISENTSRMSWFVYVIRFMGGLDRQQMMLALEDEGIPSRPYFSPIHLQPFYVKKFGFQRGDFPVAEKLADVSLALPFSSVMSEVQVDFVCEKLIKNLKRTSHGD